MRMKKAISSLFALLLITITATTAYAAGSSTSEGKTKDTHEVKYEAFTGIVKEVNAATTLQDTNYVLVENKDGAEVNFIVNKDTYLVNNEEIALGSEFTGYYDANQMAIMIYPPQYKAEVAVIKNKTTNIKVDLFDQELTSADHFLKLNIGKDTKIVKEDGSTFQGELANRKLVVFYDYMTKSIPAQTTPTKVVVLSDPLTPDEEIKAYYGAFTGTVTKITKLDQNSFKLDLKSEDEMEATFTVSEETYRTNSEKIMVGSTVTGYFDATLMMAMIYPMQYIAEVLDVAVPDHNIKVDYFNRKLLSSDGSLKLHINSATEVINQDGSVFKGRPVNQHLVVIYDVATKKLPAQTHAIKVIVLSQEK